MPGVTDLDWDFHVPTPSTSLITNFLHNFPNLHRVTLGSEFTDLGSLRTFLGACGSDIRTLVLEEGFGYRSKRKTNKKARNRANKPPMFDLSKLEELVVRSEESFFDWILDDLLLISTPSELRTLVIESEAFSCSTLNRLFETFSQTLTHLTLDPTNTSETLLSPASQISLRALTSTFSRLEVLHTLTVGLIFLGDSFSPHLAFDWTRDFLEVFQARDLVILELFCYASEPQEVVDILQTYDWGPLVTLLQKKYTSLQELVLWITMEMDFGRRERSSLEKRVQESGLGRFTSEGKRRVGMKWTIENPSWGSWSDRDSDAEQESDSDTSDDL
ncbi:hypothetical protein VNI00_000512 [Paramarasmius palmivorus]|uniref:Uncharacterized protein n=1 Tax=Paramarasmius palmivorus TaxID=297713 RepID=A0AAW0E939_9AGAR